MRLLPLIHLFVPASAIFFTGGINTNTTLLLGFEQFGNVTQSDDRFPIPVFQGVAACSKAMVRDRPAVLLLGHASNCWERQYTQDLLRKVNPVLCAGISNRTQLVAMLSKKASLGGHMGVVFSSLGRRGWDTGTLASDVEAAGHGVRPNLLIHLSEESPGELGSVELGSRYKRMLPESGGYVLRQYHRPNARYPTEVQVHEIPLGYAASFPVGADSCQMARQNAKKSHRNVTWSFFGNSVKKDRPVMLQRMQETLGTGQMSNHRNHLNGEQMFKAYQQSKLVPVGYGDKNLHCFRTYEALIAGAIPIVVGKSTERADTFATHYDRGGGSIVFADDWAQAANMAKELLQSPIKLQAHRDRLAQWYCNWLDESKDIVMKALGNPSPIPLRKKVVTVDSRGVSSAEA